MGCIVWVTLRIAAGSTFLNADSLPVQGTSTVQWMETGQDALFEDGVELAQILCGGALARAGDGAPRLRHDGTTRLLQQIAIKLGHRHQMTRRCLLSEGLAPRRPHQNMYSVGPTPTNTRSACTCGLHSHSAPGDDACRRRRWGFTSGRVT
jgi:hypothetical protein